MRSRPIPLCALVLTLICAGSLAAGAQTKLLRYPDIHGDSVVFTYGGDLWLAHSGGGAARRLTAHPGQELFGKFSPDGNWIAFTGQYDGDEQVYVIPVAGGTPKQLTYYPARGPLPPRWGYDNQVYDWSPDGSAVLFRSLRSGWDLTDSKLFLAKISGGLPESLPMPKSGAGDFSPDGSKVVYSPLVRDFRTWKRYEGGWAQELFIFDLETYDVRAVTDHPRADRDPMWIGERVFFTSDRDGKNNLYAFDTTTGSTDQITNADVWDVRWPSDDGSNRIVYELNGELEIYDIAAGRSTAISISVPDDELWMRPLRKSVGDQVEEFGLSPKANRALFVARGDLFTAPVEKGPTRNLTNTSGIREKEAAWSPDGRKIAFISDRTGEEEIYLVDQNGSGEPEQLTSNGDMRRFNPVWSPDGRWIAFSDIQGRVFVVEVATKEVTEVIDEEYGTITEYNWSPHGGFLAFSVSSLREWNVFKGFNSIYIWSASTRDLHKITDDIFHETEPVWDPQGDYLFYLSDRSYAPMLSSNEWDYATDRETFVYSLALRNDVEHPFPPQSDEVDLDDAEDDDDTGDDDDSENNDSDESSSYIEIDFDGLADRVARLPIEADNYAGLSAIEGHVLFVRSGATYYGRSSDHPPELQIFSFDDQETTTLAEGVDGYFVSDDGSKVLVSGEGAYKLYDSSPDGKESGEAVSTAKLEMDLEPAAEWTQIFNEAWRRFRDQFYVANMHGYDWEALKQQYTPWLEHVAHRSDLNYVIGELISELSVGHAYVQGGDFDIPDRPSVALPGVVFELDEASNRYRIAKILQGQNQEDSYRSPLTEIGKNVSEGDYLLAIDGQEITGSDNPYRLLRHKADRQVELTLNSDPSLEGARKVSFTPLTSETNLHYLAMITENQRKVDEASQGKVGYIHLPDMGPRGMQEFIKWYYPQVRKEGLVIDVRGNGGGNVSHMILRRLAERPVGVSFSRNDDHAQTIPPVVFNGQLVCLQNELSASDGDIFPFFFREMNLGPLIGKRTWGGVVGGNFAGPMVDGGAVFVPNSSTNNMAGEWVIEGHGVEPDIVVDNDPKSVLEGRDPQLERGIEEILRAIESNPATLPGWPEAPDKTE